jgi:hypothetical protein
MYIARRVPEELPFSELLSRTRSDLAAHTALLRLESVVRVSVTLRDYFFTELANRRRAIPAHLSGST